jgi:hypothetical protein
MLETGVAIGFGIAAGSFTLTAFGPACVLVSRLTVALRHGRVFAENAE